MEPQKLNKSEEKKLRKYGVPKYRKQIIEKLNLALKNEYLEFDDYEKRIDLVHQADSIEELNEILYDFPENTPPRYNDKPTNRATIKDLSYESYKKIMDGKHGDRTVYNIFSSSRIEGLNLPQNDLKTVNIFGSTTLDFTKENKTGKLFELNVFNLLGETKVIVPPTMKVKSNITSILGEFREQNRGEFNEDEADQLLIITGFSMLGEVVVKRPKKGFWRNIFIK